MKENLELEIKKLKTRLEKAVIFEVGDDISIGISVEDDMWRIRRDVSADDFIFLNKDGMWEEPPVHQDIVFARRTGHILIDDAFDAWDKYMQSPDKYSDMIYNLPNGGFQN